MGDYYWSKVRFEQLSAEYFKLSGSSMSLTLHVNIALFLFQVADAIEHKHLDARITVPGDLDEHVGTRHVFGIKVVPNDPNQEPWYTKRYFNELYEMKLDISHCPIAESI